MEPTDAPAGKTHPVAGVLVGILTFIGASVFSSIAVYAAWVAWFVSRSEESASVFIKLVFVKPVAMLFGFDGPGLIGNPVILKSALLTALAVSLLAGIWVGSKVYRRSA